MYRLTNAGLLALVLATGPAFAGSPVVQVRDGDSLVVQSGGQEVEVRLAYIDAPEFDQAHGKKAGARCCDLWSVGAGCDSIRSEAMCTGGSWRERSPATAT